VLAPGGPSADFRFAPRKRASDDVPAGTPDTLAGRRGCRAKAGGRGGSDVGGGDRPA
jgi:hypothetical protein